MRVTVFNKVIFILFCILSGLIIIETVARFGDFQRSIISYDSQLVWTYVPYLKIDNLSINSQGFRDNSHSVVKHNNYTRIAFVGDSYTAGLGISEIFSKIIDRKLNSASKKYEIFNFGVSAYGTDQEYLVLKEIVLEYDPDIVILSVVPNDIRESYVKGLFTLEYGKLKLDQSNKAFNINPLDKNLWSLATKSQAFYKLQGILGLKYGTFDHIFNNITKGVFFDPVDNINVDQILFLKNEPHPH